MEEKKHTTVADLTGKTTEDVVRLINTIEDEVEHYRMLYAYAKNERDHKEAKLNAIKAVLDL